MARTNATSIRTSQAVVAEIRKIHAQLIGATGNAGLYQADALEAAVKVAAKHFDEVADMVMRGEVGNE